MNLNEARISIKHGELETTEKHQAEKDETWSSIKQGAVSSLKLQSIKHGAVKPGAVRYGSPKYEQCARKSEA
jgi:hypothetical protein